MKGVGRGYGGIEQQREKEKELDIDNSGVIGEGSRGGGKGYKGDKCNGEKSMNFIECCQNRPFCRMSQNTCACQ